MMNKLSLAVATLSLFVTLKNCLSTTETHEWQICPFTGTGRINCTTPHQTISVTSATYGQIKCACPQLSNVNCTYCGSWNITERLGDFCQDKSVCNGSYGIDNFRGSLDCTANYIFFVRVSYTCQIVTTPSSRVDSTSLPNDNVSTSQPVTRSTTTRSPVPSQTLVPAVSNKVVGHQLTGTFIVGTGSIPTPLINRPSTTSTKTTEATIAMATKTVTPTRTATSGRVYVPRRSSPLAPTEGRRRKALPGGSTLPITIGATVSGVVLLVAIATVVIVMKRKRGPTPAPSRKPHPDDVTPDPSPEPTYDTIREEEEGGVTLALSGATCSYSTIGQNNVTSDPVRDGPVYSKPDKNKAKTARNVEDLYAKPTKKESGEVENVLYESAGGISGASLGPEGGTDNVMYACADDI